MTEAAARGLSVKLPGFLGALFTRRSAKVAERRREDVGGEEPSGPLVALMICNDVSESMVVRVALQSYGIGFRVQGDIDPFRIMCPSQQGYCTLYVGQGDLELALNVVGEVLQDS